MIVRYDMNAQRRWNRGELQVEVRVPGRERPLAYCDGTDDDIAELEAIAQSEGTELPVIQRRVLKTGREIWTIGTAPPDDEEPMD